MAIWLGALQLQGPGLNWAKALGKGPLVYEMECSTCYSFGATWCGDCRVHIPEIAKIVDILGDKIIIAGVLGGIKVKAPFQRKKGEPIWKSPPSPPETIDQRFDMGHIPAIFIFKRDGKCIGKIDERPSHTRTIEGDILHYVKKGI